MEKAHSKLDRIALAAVEKEIKRALLGQDLAGFRAWYRALILQTYPNPNGMTAQGFADEVTDFVMSMRDKEFEQDIKTVGYQSALQRMASRRPIFNQHLKQYKDRYKDGNW